MGKSEEQEKIKHQRRLIDTIDHKIIILLHKRFKLCAEIAHHKKESSISIKQEEREQEILQTRANEALKVGISQSFITTLFRIIMKQSRTIQKEEEGF